MERRRYHKLSYAVLADKSFEDIISFLIKESFIRIDIETGCWVWYGARGGNGERYGRINIQVKGKKMRPAHRILYEKKYGKIPEGLEPHHTCSNTLCVNPDHIEPRVHKDHTGDWRR